jgi:hypothetical protein
MFRICSEHVIYLAQKLVCSEFLDFVVGRAGAFNKEIYPSFYISLYPRVPIIRTHNSVHVKESFQDFFLSNQIHFSIKQIFAF